MIKNTNLFFLLLIAAPLIGQSFYFGADMSYVNEMEDCGVKYHENQVEQDPYSIFKNHGCNLVRLRLWHSPKWYDTLNEGNRYSDLNDCKLAISRAKENDLEVLLDFHLSDNWADPSKQLVPEAWLPVVDDLDLLKDSLYNYMLETLSELHEDGLLPDMIQIGNETNKGILLSPEDNAVWTLDWDRNAALFNEAIKAVKDFEEQSNTTIKTMLHLAGPSNAEWLLDGFMEHGVTDFDVIGISYYWAWHAPTTIENTGEVITTLKNLYPDKEVVIVETGYIWTNQWNDNASNIITETHPDYTPASPENQRDWLIDLTQKVLDVGGDGVVYWEPAWVSSDCYTQWGQGSHQEHATFFDFENNLLLPGGIEFMSQEYNLTSSIKERPKTPEIQILSNSFSGDIKIKIHSDNPQKITYTVADSSGVILLKDSFTGFEKAFKLEGLAFGIYFVSVWGEGEKKVKKMVYGDD